jgi:hypothetical protein
MYTINHITATPTNLQQTDHTTTNVTNIADHHTQPPTTPPATHHHHTSLYRYRSQ